MSLSRRDLLLSAATAALSNACTAVAAETAGDGTLARVRAVAFDGLALFDPRPVFAEMTHTFGPLGPAFVQAFQSRQFEYTWLRTLTASYVDFRGVTDDALRFAHRATGAELPDAVRLGLLEAFNELEPWPDVATTLDALAGMHLDLAVLSNFAPPMLEALARRSGLQTRLALLSVDAVRAYKPDPRAYALATRHFRCAPAEVAFVAFAGWDAAGGRRFGFRTYWANRTQASTELLGVTADRTAPGLEGLAEFVADSQDAGRRRDPASARRHEPGARVGAPT